MLLPDIYCTVSAKSRDQGAYCVNAEENESIFERNVHFDLQS